jgi:hypothetical protein
MKLPWPGIGRRRQTSAIGLVSHAAGAGKESPVSISLSLSLQFNFVTIFQKDNVGITISPTVPHRPPLVSIIFQNCLCLKHFCVKPRFPIKLYIYTI